MQNQLSNIEVRTVDGFGLEWDHYSQDEVSSAELKVIFDQYFKIFPLHLLSRNHSVGADFGCGSGRWAKILAPQIKELTLIDASEKALSVAKKKLAPYSNIKFQQGSIEQATFQEGLLDFAFSLGVLHHLPDTQKALQDIAKTLKPGAPFLVYLYYAFDNKPIWYRFLWKISEVARFCISRTSFPIRRAVTQAIAAAIYWPLARAAWLLEKLNCLPSAFPLSYYRHRSFYIMKNDALDRFGTFLEKRYTKTQISELLNRAGFERITFSDSAPYWCAVAYKTVEKNN